MKRFTAVSSAVAAATLVSATALMGASGAGASEPLRLNAAQVDTVPAGNGSESVGISQSTTTVVEGGKVRTVRERTIIRDGKKWVEREVTEEPLDAKRHRPHMQRRDIPNFQEDIDAFRSDIDARLADAHERQAELRSHAESRVAELRQRAAAFRERAHRR
jgi:hypothetical protein